MFPHNQTQIWVEKHEGRFKYETQPDLSLSVFCGGRRYRLGRLVPIVFSNSRVSVIYMFSPAAL
jgi:hypothetical protein